MPWPKGVSTEHLRVWTPEQEQYLKENYDGTGSALADVLPFTASGIRNKAKRLGVKNNGHFHNVEKTILPKLEERDLAYIAGFMDGEGCITHATRTQYAIQHRIQIANSDESVIHWINYTLGIGRVRKHQPKGDHYLMSHSYSISKQGDVWAFLEVIIPYLKVKQFKAIGVLEDIKRRFQNIQ